MSTVDTRIIQTNRRYREWLGKAIQLRLEGYSYQEIAEWCNRNGHFTRKGVPWTKDSIRNLLVPRMDD